MLIDMKVVIVVYYDVMFLFLILKNRIFIKTYNDMTQNQFKMIICTVAGIIVAYLRNLNRIPTGDNIQWTVDHAVPFIAGFAFCYAALCVWQWCGNNIWSIKSWMSRHLKNFSDDMLRED